MSVLIKIGRRTHRNTDKKWFLRSIIKTKAIFSIQTYMWNTILYSIKLATIKMNQSKKKNRNNPDYTFDYTKRTYKEEENINYNIEWIELIMSGTYEEEKEEFDQAMQFFSKMENNPVFKQRMGNVEVDPELSAEYSKKVSGKKAKKVMQKGFEKVKNVTIAKALNDVGILVFIEPPKKHDDLLGEAKKQEDLLVDQPEVPSEAKEVTNG